MGLGNTRESTGNPLLEDKMGTSWAPEDISSDFRPLGNRIEPNPRLGCPLPTYSQGGRNPGLGFAA